MQKLFRMQAVLTAALLALGASQIMSADNGGGGGNGVRLRATLHGAAIQRIRPEGNADFRIDSPTQLRLKVEVENVNLPNGTKLVVSIQHAGSSMNVGTIVLTNAGEAELELESEHGQSVPVVHRGDTVTVSHDSDTIAAGVFITDN